MEAVDIAMPAGSVLREDPSAKNTSPPSPARKEWAPRVSAPAFVPGAAFAPATSTTAEAATATAAQAPNTNTGTSTAGSSGTTKDSPASDAASDVPSSSQTDVPEGMTETKLRQLCLQFESDDLYLVLGIARDADPETIKRAYRQLSRKHHPDKARHERAAGWSAAINRANSILSDPERRRLFDSYGTRSLDPDFKENSLDNILGAFWAGMGGTRHSDGSSAASSAGSVPLADLLNNLMFTTTTTTVDKATGRKVTTTSRGNHSPPGISRTATTPRTQQSKPAQQAKPAEKAKPTEQPKPEQAKPAEQAPPAEQVKPKPIEQVKPTEQVQPAEQPQPKPTEKAKPAEQVKPKPVEQAKPAEQSKVSTEQAAGHQNTCSNCKDSIPIRMGVVSNGVWVCDDCLSLSSRNRRVESAPKPHNRHRPAHKR